MVRHAALILIAILTLTACAASLRVEKLQDFTPESKTVVLLNSTQWDAKLRTELAKRGFKVLRFAARDTVISEGKEGELARVFREADARYGITFGWEGVDRCLYNSSRLINGTVEVTDLRTNEVLLVIEKGGWTGPCADPRGMAVVRLLAMYAPAWVGRAPPTLPLLFRHPIRRISTGSASYSRAVVTSSQRRK
jgi:hypothetical protein